MFLNNMKEESMHESLSTIEISIHLLAVFQIKIMFWIIVAIEER